LNRADIAIVAREPKLGRFVADAGAEMWYDGDICPL